MMKILVDMSLSPAWSAFLRNAGWEARHCSTLDEPHYRDAAVVNWARLNSHILFTHNLDFGAALSMAGKTGPSIFQVSATDVLPHNTGPAVVRTLRELEGLLVDGALVLVDLGSGKARVFRITGDTSNAN